MTTTTTTATTGQDLANPLAGLEDGQKPAAVVRAQAVADQAYSSVTELTIDSATAYAAAGEDLVDLRTRWRAIENQRVHMKEPFLEGCRRVDAFFRVPLDRLAQAADLLKGRMLEFERAESERVERERQAREAEERRQREELERQAREAEERNRRAREEMERAEREAREARERAEREAREAEAAGDRAAADAAAAEAERVEREAAERRALAQQDAIAAAQQADQVQAAIDLAEVAPAMPVVASQAKAAGVSSRKTWKVRSIDKAALVLATAQAIEAGDRDKADQLLAYLSVDETALNGVARSLKGAARVPGVTFGEVATLAARGR